MFLFPSFAIVGVDIAILAHPIGVQFIMRAIPWFFVPAVLVIAVVAHAFGVVLAIGVAAVVDLFAEFKNDYIFFFIDFT